MAMTPEFQAFMEEHFSLDNYAGAADLDLKRWSRLFQHRFVLGIFGSNDDQSKNIEVAKKLLNDPTDGLTFDLIKDKNSKPIRDWGLYDYFISKKIIEPMEEEFQALHDVWEEKLAHLKYSKSYLKFGKKSLSDRKMQLLVKSFSHTARKTKTFMEVQESKRHLMQPGDSSSLNRRDLKVDMDFPDDILKTAFDKWLISTRTQINTSRGDRHVKREFNNSDIEKWVQRQTLPYLDLRLASQYFNCKLNDDEVGYYLFRELPIGVNSRDKLRAIKKRAKQMSDHTVLVSLEACTIEREE